jgi:hypothetical protein
MPLHSRKGRKLLDRHDVAATERKGAPQELDEKVSTCNAHLREVVSSEEKDEEEKDGEHYDRQDRDGMQL